jgi:hypothetical protein
MKIVSNTSHSDSRGNRIQEWDGILLSSKDTLYLLEAKHVMSMEKLQKIADRVKEFPQIIKSDRKLVGVACGAQFPSGCLEEAHRLGLMAVYPSGSRYIVIGNIDIQR